jgi:hypothetical protein
MRPSLFLWHNIIISPLSPLSLLKSTCVERLLIQVPVPRGHQQEIGKSNTIGGNDTD